MLTATVDHPGATREPDHDFNPSMERQFRVAAGLLESQGADSHRVRAYRRAADSLHYLDQPASEIYRQKGIPGLIELPAIGEALAQAIADVVDFGTWRWLDRLQGSVQPERVLSSVAGIGTGLAKRIHEKLDIESLEELEVAAHDGRLGTVEGLGPKRIRAVADSLAGRLGRPPVRTVAAELTPTSESGNLPSKEELLDIDREYRTRATNGELPVIAPRRFNPDNAAWLPILHTVRNGRHYTALYSNTARAHQLGRTHDWVVIYLDDADGGQWTALTAARGPRAGQRVIRGLTGD